MEIRMQDKKAKPLSGVEPALAEVLARLQKHPGVWLQKLRAEPGAFADLEKSVHRAFQEMADQVVAGLLAEVTAPAAFAETAKKKVAAAEDDAGKPTHRSGEQRPLRIRLLGGLLLWVTTLYCSPRRRTGQGRGREGGGLYPELGVLGITEGKSPALVRDVGRLTALLPSYAAARAELAERGVKLTQKEVHGIGVHAGQAALAYRRREMECYRAGELAAGDGRGKRFGVQVDGGRCKLRTTTRQQKGTGTTKTQKRRFQSDWREPKLIIVFEMDEQGRLKKGTQPIIDGTFGGPDEIMEILALRLHQVGAQVAEVVAFRADGAPWIWDRWAWVIRRLGLRAKQVSKGLDWPHAMHHISLALAHLVEGAERRRVFKKYRKWLKAGRWHKVICDLTALGLVAPVPSDSPLWTEINYLDRHGSAGHLDYATFRRRGLPLGSGAIESTIRRVVNMRMKGNSIHWEQANAEAMLALRGLVLSGRWNQTFAKILESLARDRRLDCNITSPNMPEQLKAAKEIKPPKPQPQAAKARCGAAA